MPGSRVETIPFIGARPVIREGEKTSRQKIAPNLYSQKEISLMSKVPPVELDDGEYVYTPVGKWHRDHDLLILDMKAAEQIERTTKPTFKEKLSKVAKVVFQVS